MNPENHQSVNWNSSSYSTCQEILDPHVTPKHNKLLRPFHASLASNKPEVRSTQKKVSFNFHLSASEFAKIQMFCMLCAWLQSLNLTSRAVDSVSLAGKEQKNCFFTEALRFSHKGAFVFYCPCRPTLLACKMSSVVDGAQSLLSVGRFTVSPQAWGSCASAGSWHHQSEDPPGQMESSRYFIRFEDRPDS